MLQEVHGPRLWLNYGDDFRREAVPSGTDCIHGHIPGDAYDRVFQQPRYITFVRHPVQRVVSNYYHFLRSPDDRNFVSLRLHSHKLSLRQFAELPEMRNEASRYVAGRAPEEFAFVGIAERFAESLLLYRKIFKIGPPLTIFHENANRERTTPTYPISSDDHNFLAALNALDVVWYERACRVFEQMVAWHTPDARELSQAIAGFAAVVPI